MNCKPPEQLDLVLLARPCCRTVAYCTVMRQLGVYPRELIWLPGEMSFLPELLKEDGLYNYSGRFFDLSLDPLEWCRRSGSLIYKPSTDDINSLELVQKIAECNAPDLIFSAAGIVAPETLATGKRFIHAHPGHMPDYRGSTCFYYSLLEQGEVAATAFVMNEGIDTGDILARLRFKLNMKISSRQHLFMDQILDPYIRARVLEIVIKRLRDKEILDVQPCHPSSQPVCYVMHPLLRVLAVNRLNGQYIRNQPTGLFERI